MPLAHLWREASLAARFLAAATIAIGLPMILLGWLVNSEVRSARIQSVARIDAFYIGQMVQPILTRLSGDLASEEFERELARWLDDWPRARPTAVNILLRDGTVAYSTDEGIIGTSLSSQALETAFEGEVVADLELTEHGRRRQAQAAQPLLEIYVPLFRPGTSEVVAVGEIYERATILAAEIRRSAIIVWGLVGLATVLILALLFLSVRAVEHVITAQRREIRQRLARSVRLTRLNERLRREAVMARLDAVESNESLLNKIAYDIHDGPIQLLSLLSLQLGTARPGEIADGQRPHAHSVVSDAIRDLRNLSHGLALPELDNLDVEETVRLAVVRHENLTGTDVAMSFDTIPLDMPPTLKICVYRVVQEGLNNAFKHAQGVGQTVSVKGLSGFLDIEVGDGGGSQPARQAVGAGSGLGLSGLAKRLALVGGTLGIDTVEGGGTMLRARMPIAAAPKEGRNGKDDEASQAPA
jgi:signal transduction histidine kinase